MNYSERLHRAIPGGAHTYSRGDDQFPSNAPQILDSGKGAYVIDPDGNQYLDYGMALRSVTLGYANERVNGAVIQAINKGVNLTRASLLELEAAELLINLIPSIEMVKFAKNGSNVTTAAVKIARASTGRRYICVPRQQPFFSFDDWFIGTTPVKRGVQERASADTLLFDYGDINSLEALFVIYGDQVAGVMLEPATTILPCQTSCRNIKKDEFKDGCLRCPNLGGNFLHQVQELCRLNGALFILDEMITGFRWHLQGAQTFFGVDPDLTTFGKGMANGYAISAIGGKRRIMEMGAINKPHMERTFLLSTTHGAEMTGLAAFIETVDIYKDKNVVNHLWDYGKQLKNGINQISRDLRIENYFYVEGPAICLSYVTKDLDGVGSLEMRTLFMQEMIKNGVMMPWISISLSHGNDEIIKTLDAVKNALTVYKKALDFGVGSYLMGVPIKPVFRVRN
jgi:glutamate-1-semialdehyde 2,1-aminomutase